MNLANRISAFWHAQADLWLMNGLLAVGFVALGWVLGKFASRGIRRMASRTGNDTTAPIFLASFVRYGILLLAILLALGRIGIETASLIALLGAAGLAIGLALQGTLSDVAAGLVLLIVRPFRIGDTIETTGHQGVVHAITLFTTELYSADRRKIILPNSLVWRQPILNFSTAPRRVDLIVTVAADADISRAIALMQEVLARNPEIAREPAPTATIESLADGARIRVSGWPVTAQPAEIASTLYADIARQLSAENIPLVQRPTTRATS